jgi:hypothetical protein
VTAVLDTSAERRLRDLYARYKALALATGAALVLDARDEALAADVDALLRDCLTARRASVELEPQFAACVEATGELRLLVRGEESSAALERARESHRRLRRAVWSVLPCEYVPCCAEHAHHER